MKKEELIEAAKKLAAAPSCNPELREQTEKWMAAVGSPAEKAEAQKFLAFLTRTEGQRILGEGYSFEYPVASDVPANPALPALDTLDAPAIDPSTLNGPDVIQLMIDAGLL